MFKLGYLQTPKYGKGQGIGDGFSALGKSIGSLGDMAIEDKERKRKARNEQFKLDLLTKQDKRADEQFSLAKAQDSRDAKTAEAKQKALAYELEVARDNRRSKQEREAAEVSVFRKLHPKSTKHLSDAEVRVFGSQVQKEYGKNPKITKMDTRITPDGMKVLTYTENGVIKEKTLGKVKSDWNEKKASSSTPEGYIEVGKDFYEEYAHRGIVKQSKDGKFIAPISIVNKLQKEQIGGANLLDSPLR